MDRVNRRYLATSATIAIPAALLMVSLSIGTNPETASFPWGDSTTAPERTGSEELGTQDSQVVLTGGALDSTEPQDSVKPQGSVGQSIELAVGTEDRGEVAQVVGKQPHPRNRHPSHAHHQSSGKPARSASKSPRGSGLFDGLFGGRRSSRSRHEDNIQRGLTASTTHPDDVSWDGIPYHNVKRRSSKSNPRTNTRLATLPPPLRSKSATSSRVIRGGSQRPSAGLQPINRSSRPKLAKVPTPALSVPVPPPVNQLVAKPSARSNTDSLAKSRSSRRDRETNHSSPLDITKIYKGSSKSTASYNNNDVPDLIPRVSRRKIQPVVPKLAKVAKKPAKKTIAAKTKASKPPTPVVGKPEPDTKAIPTAQPVEAVAKSEAKPQTITKPAPPMVKLELPKVAAVDKSKSGYSQPVDPKTSPVPAPPARTESMGLAPAPTASVGHRLPNSPPEPSVPSKHFATQPIVQPVPEDNFSAVGSGLRSHAGSAKLQNPASGRTPQANPRTPFGIPPHRTSHRTAQRNPDSTFTNRDGRFNDPYQRDRQPRHNRFSTSGQPVAPQIQETSPTAIDSLAGDRRFPASSPQEGNRIPLREIPDFQGQDSSQGHHSGLDSDNKRMTRRSSSQSQPKVSSDSFEPIPYGSRNEMRHDAGTQATMKSQGAQIVASELPGIRVVTQGPSEVMIRQTNEYQIRVENRGSIDAEGVLVRVHIPDWADVQGHNATRGELNDQQQDNDPSRMVWTIDHLPAGASEQLFVRLMAARSGTYNLDVDWTLVPQKSIAQVRVHEPKLQLKIEGPDSVVYGDSQTYKVRVLNPGDGTAPNVVFTLSPNSATPQSQKIGDIPAGKEAQFEVELTAQDLGELKINGLATGDLELRSEANKTIRVSAAKLEAVIAGPELKYKDTEAVYSLQLENLGDATSRNIVATLRVPSGAKYLGGIEGVTVQRGVLKWNVSDLAPGMTREYQFKCNMNATGTQLFALDCKGSASGQAAVTIETVVESIADLVLEIKDPIAPAPIGREVIYEIIVHNRGSREAIDIRTIAQFSHGIEPLRTEGQSGEIVTGQVLFDPIPRIGPGEEVRLRVVAEAERAGHHRFRTEVRSGDTVLVAEEATHYMNPRSDRVSHRSSEQTLTR